jgi:DNA-binding transcriptional ArsR family regulator
MTPTPSIVQLSLEYELEQMLATPPELVRKNIHTLIQHAGDSEIRQYFLAYPADALYCLAEEMRLYWRRVLEHHWNRLTAILDGDVLYRARQMALDGPEYMLKDLNPQLTYAGGVLEIHKEKNQHEKDYQLTGDGLQLVPTVFGGPHLYWQIESDWTPMLIYGARGIGLWDQTIPQRNESLEIALGEGRARVLQVLSTPSNTGEIARRLHMTAGAASQHLSKLNQAGLVEPHRSGKRVYYHLTDRGAQLLVLFDRAL